MRKTLLTTFVILLSLSSAQAASTQGRVKMTVIRTNLQPADVNIIRVQNSQSTTITSSNSQMVEVIY